MDILTVFLDIDGVLNTKDSWKRPFQLNDTCILRFCNTLQNQKTPVNIILTSSWKNGDLGEKIFYTYDPEDEKYRLNDGAPEWAVPYSFFMKYKKGKYKL